MIHLDIILLGVLVATPFALLSGLVHGLLRGRGL